MNTTKQLVEVSYGRQRIKIMLEAEIIFHEETMQYEVYIPEQHYREGAELAVTKAVFDNDPRRFSIDRFSMQTDGCNR